MIIQPNREDGIMDKHDLIEQHIQHNQEQSDKLDRVQFWAFVLAYNLSGILLIYTVLKIDALPWGYAILSLSTMVSVWGVAFFTIGHIDVWETDDDARDDGAH
jgi:hypothetical protein